MGSLGLLLRVTVIVRLRLNILCMVPIILLGLGLPAYISLLLATLDILLRLRRVLCKALGRVLGTEVGRSKIGRLGLTVL